MKKVIITGCFGFIGKKLVKYLLEKGIAVYGMDIRSADFFSDNQNFHFVKLDFDDNLAGYFENEHIDVLYHLAWNGVSTLVKNDPDKQFSNIPLVYKILELGKQIGVSKIVIPGSMSEFSRSSSPVTGYENDSPADLYAATKVAIRKIAYQFCLKNNIDLNWLLITSVYSEERKDANLITTCIQSLKEGRTFECTKLEQQWDYLHIDDLIQAMYLVGSKGERCLIYPVGSGEVHPLSYYVEMIGKKLHKEELLRVGSLPYKNNYIDNSIPDITRLKQLGFVNTRTFAAYIDEMIK